MPISSVGDYIIHIGHAAQEHRVFNQASGSIDVMQAIVQIASLYHIGVLEYTFPAGYYRVGFRDIIHNSLAD